MYYVCVSFYGDHAFVWVRMSTEYMCSACVCDSLNGNNSFVWIICQLRIVRMCVIVFMTTMLYVCVYMYFSSFREPWSKVKQGVREEGPSEGTHQRRYLVKFHQLRAST